MLAAEAAGTPETADLSANFFYQNGNMEEIECENVAEDSSESHRFRLGAVTHIRVSEKMLAVEDVERALASFFHRQHFI